MSVIRPDWLTRETTLSLVLLLMTLASVALCAWLMLPFLNALTWAIAFSVIAAPVNRWLYRRLGSRNAAALLSLIFVCLVIVIPGVFLFRIAIQELRGAVEWAAARLDNGDFSKLIDRPAGLRPVIDEAMTSLDLKSAVNRLAGTVATSLTSMVTGSFRALASIGVGLFTLFFFFRDGQPAIEALYRYLPLSTLEMNYLIKRVGDTIHATIYGKFAAAASQGCLGGLMFFFLGLPAPLLWGSAMAFAALIPMVGPVVIWGPATAMLFAKGLWVKGIIMALWGLLAVGFIDNLVYPIIVGNRLQMHTLVVFFSVFGGLILFGFSGLVLGPVLVSVTMGLIEVWRLRMPGVTEPELQIR